MMAKTVWKWVVPFRGGPMAPVPKGGRIVHCGADPETGEPALWVEVDPEAELERRQFQIVPTGGDVPPVSKHRGTAICGSFVWHVYELGAS